MKRTACMLLAEFILFFLAASMAVIDRAAAQEKGPHRDFLQFPRLFAHRGRRTEGIFY